MTNVNDAITAALSSDRIYTLKPGKYVAKGPLKLDPRKPFYIGGTIPSTPWPQAYYEGLTPLGASITVTGLKPSEPWIQYITPPDVNVGGPQILEKLTVQRDADGPLLQFGAAGDPSVYRAPNRGLLFRDCAFYGPRGPHWVNMFTGGELPAPSGAYIQLENQYDARLEGVSAWGGETQILASGCDRLRISGFHGGNCGRSIVADGATPALIDGAHIENVGISGIDASCAQVVNSNVEVGYKTKVGPSPLPATAKFTVTAGSSRVDVTGVDPRKWIAPRSVVKLADKPLYVLTVDERGFTFLGHDCHCVLPAMSGDGTQLVRIFGVPYIMRGDFTVIDNWCANINTPERSNVPVACFFPNKTPIHARGLTVGQNASLNGGSEAILGGWSERQWAYYGSVRWHDDASLAPKHDWCWRVGGPTFDANQRTGQ